MAKKGGSTSAQNTSLTPWSRAEPLLGFGLDETQRLYDTDQLTAAPYAGPRVAGQSPETQAALSGMASIAGSNPITGAATGAYTDMLSADPYRDLDMVKAQALESVLPQMRSMFSNSGMLNSSIAGDQITGAATRAIAPIEYGAYESGQNRRLAALGMAPQMQAAQYTDPLMLAQAGQAQDDYQQRLIDSDIGAYYEGADRPYTNLQRLSGLAMGYGGLGGQNTGTTTQQNSAGTTGMVGAGLSMLPLLFGLSDRRLKRDISRIGESREGYPLYSFRYLWGPARFIGVMADEVPERLTIDVGGYKAVDYRGVTA